MRLLRFVSIALCAGIGSIPAQPNDPNYEACVRARKTLDQGIAAAGGEPAFAALTDSTRRLTGVRVDLGQAFKPGVPYTSQPMTENSVLDFKNGRYLFSVDSNYLGGLAIHVKQVVRETDAARIAQMFGSRFSLYRYPEVALRMALSRPESLRARGKSNKRGKSFELVDMADRYGNQVTLYFDTQSHLLAKTEMLRDESTVSLAGPQVEGWEYLDYQSVDGLQVPHHLVVWYGGEVYEDMKVTEAHLNTHPPDQTFGPPPGGTAGPGAPPPPPPFVTKLSDDVYFLNGGGYSSMFVVFNDHVVVVEGPFSGTQTQRSIAAIKEVAPGKPIRYVVSTHYHHDHLRGLRGYIAEGATIVTTANTKAEIEKLAAAPQGIRPDMLAIHPRQATYEIFAGKKVITDGTHTVELYDVGKNPHVDELVIAYLPKEKILFESDMLDIYGVPEAHEDTLDFVDKIHKLGLQPQVIAPGHGRPGSIEDLDKAVAQKRAGATPQD